MLLDSLMKRSEYGFGFVVRRGTKEDDKASLSVDSSVSDDTPSNELVVSIHVPERVREGHRVTSSLDCFEPTSPHSIPSNDKHSLPQLPPR